MTTAPSRDAKKMLDELAALMAKKDLLAMDKADLVRKVIPVEVQEKLNEIEAEFLDQGQIVDERIEKLSAEIREWVKFTGETTKGEALMAVYNKPRVQWDTEKLDGMAALIPQIKEARQESSPSVTIRKR